MVRLLSRPRRDLVAPPAGDVHRDGLPARRRSGAAAVGVLTLAAWALVIVGAVALQGMRPGTPLWEAIPGQLPGSSTVGDAGAVPVTDAPADDRADVAIAFALAQRGIPYVWGGDGPAEGGWDCSGLTKAAYAEAGVELPRTAAQQFADGPHTSEPDDPAPGDLVFYGTPDAIHHVGLSLGNGVMVHAPHTGAVVEIARIRWPGDDYVGATRPAAPGTAVDPGALGDVVEPSGPAPTDPAPEGPVIVPIDTPAAAGDPALAAAAAAAPGPAPVADVPAVPVPPVEAVPAAVPVPAATTGRPAPAIAVPAPVTAAVLPPGSSSSSPVGTSSPPAPSSTSPPAATSPPVVMTSLAAPRTTTTTVPAPPTTTPPTPSPPTTTATRATTAAGVPVVVRIVTGPEGVARCLAPPAVGPETVGGELLAPCPAAGTVP